MTTNSQNQQNIVNQPTQQMKQAQSLPPTQPKIHKQLSTIVEANEKSDLQTSPNRNSALKLKQTFSFDNLQIEEMKRQLSNLSSKNISQVEKKKQEDEKNEEDLKPKQIIKRSSKFAGLDGLKSNKEKAEIASKIFRFRQKYKCKDKILLVISYI